MCLCMCLHLCIFSMAPSRVETQGTGLPAESKKHVVRDAALSAVLFAPAAASMLLNAWHSKVTGERKLHAAITLIVGGIAFMCASFPHESWTKPEQHD